jgi:PBSX family phage portal protein
MSEDTDDDTTKAAVNVTELGGGLEKAENTQQLDDRRIATDIGRGIKPPYTPDRLAGFFELNETHAASIRKKARYEVGHGFDIAPPREVTAGEANDEQFERVDEFWHGTDSRWQLGPQGTAAATPHEVLEQARINYHAVGWCALEILTAGDGTPAGLAHIPARTIRVRKEESDNGEIVRGHGYVQIRQGLTRFFGEAGDRYGDDPTLMDGETGETADDARNLENDPANELIFMLNPSPLTTYYGVPDWVAATRTIAADEAAKDYNHDFFDNAAIPRYAVKVTGGELTEESKRDLREMFQNLQGEPHRTVLLEVEKFNNRASDDVEIELVPLSASRTEDMDFEGFRDRNEHEIAKVHEVPPVLLNRTETTNRSNADAQRQEFALDVIAPEQRKFEARLYQVLHQQGLDAPDWTIEFDLRGADRPKREAEIARTRIVAARGGITVNEARDELGLGPLTDDEDEPRPEGDTLLADLGADPLQQATGADAKDRPDHLPPTAHRIGERAEVPLTLADKQGVESMQFDSSNLEQGLYDAAEEELYIRFGRADGSDSLYVYLGVSESTWEGLASAASHGSYHHDNIRTDYPYEEITDNHSRLPDAPSPDGEELPTGV